MNLIVPFPINAKLPTWHTKQNLHQILETILEKKYYRNSEATFKQRYENHKKSFNHVKQRADRETSKKYWRRK